MNADQFLKAKAQTKRLFHAVVSSSPSKCVERNRINPAFVALAQPHGKAPALMHRDIERLLAGQIDTVRFGPDTDSGQHTAALIFPGSFNPLHDGHRRMAHIAAERMGLVVEFEISVANVDKPTLTAAEIGNRLKQFDAKTPVWFSLATTFVEKAQNFPASTMIIGVDTLVRLGAIRHYQNRAARDSAIMTLADLQCRFLVFGRVIDGRFQTLEMLDLPHGVEKLCDGVPAEVFRNDCSSSSLR